MYFPHSLSFQALGAHQLAEACQVCACFPPRHRSATKWDLLPPFVFHDKDQADLAPTLAAHLCGGRRRFSGADRVALLLEYAPWVEGAWGHKMLVVFDKAGNECVPSCSPVVSSLFRLHSASELKQSTGGIWLPMGGPMDIQKART